MIKIQDVSIGKSFILHLSERGQSLSGVKVTLESLISSETGQRLFKFSSKTTNTVIAHEKHYGKYWHLNELPS